MFKGWYGRQPGISGIDAIDALGDMRKLIDAPLKRVLTKYEPS